MNTWQILGVSWAGDVPSLLTRVDQNRTSELVSLLGRKLSYRVRPRRVCLGHITYGESGPAYVDCHNDPGPAPRCERCAAVENVLAASMHQAHKLGRAYVDRRHTAHLDNPHRLYLAAFPDGSLKVGTSVGSSGGVRLIEQGAWLARYVAIASDGYAVRELEDLVTAELGVVQAVSTRRKLHGLAHRVDHDLLRASLTTTTVQVHRLIASSADGIDPVDVAWNNPCVDDDRWTGAAAYPLRLDTGNHVFTIASVCGRVGLIERASSPDRLLVDLGQLRGLEVELADVEPDAVEVQASLF